MNSPYPQITVLLLLLATVRSLEANNLQDIVDRVVPGGTLSGFTHGAKCRGYYGDRAATKLLDISLHSQGSKSDYKSTKDLIHPGIDISAPEGSPVFPVADGEVEAVIQSEKDPGFRSLGYAVLLSHSVDARNRKEQIYSLYLHLQEPPPISSGPVYVGKRPIGKVGKTGSAFGSHLHFELRRFPEFFHPNWRNIYWKGLFDQKPGFDTEEFRRDWVDLENEDLAILFGDGYFGSSSQTKPVTAIPKSNLRKTEGGVGRPALDLFKGSILGISIGMSETEVRNALGKHGIRDVEKVSYPGRLFLLQSRNLVSQLDGGLIFNFDGEKNLTRIYSNSEKVSISQYPKLSTGASFAEFRKALGKPDREYLLPNGKNPGASYVMGDFEFLVIRKEQLEEVAAIQIQIRKQ